MGQFWENDPLVTPARTTPGSGLELVVPPQPDQPSAQTPTQERGDELANRERELRIAEAEREAADAQRRETDMRSALDQVRLTVRNARNARRLSSEGWFTTGFGSRVTSRLAPGGTAPADLQALLSQIGSNTAFDRLQRMREESPTGGAVGNVTERELELLRNSVASLDVTQSDDAFQRSMDDIIRNYANVYQRLGGNIADLGIEPESLAGETVRFLDEIPEDDPRDFTPEQREQIRVYASQPGRTPGELDAYMRGLSGGRIGAGNAEEVLRRFQETGELGEVAPLPPPDISDARDPGGGVAEATDATMRTAANTVLAGIPDRLSAAADTVFSGGTYAENLARQHTITAYDWQHHPIASLVGLAGGAIAVPSSARSAAFAAAAQTIRGGGTRAAALSAARNAAALRLGMEGGGYGAVQGYTGSEGDALDGVAQAALNAVVGSATGGALPYAGAAAGAAGRGVVTVFRGAPALAERVAFRTIRADGNSAATLSRQAAEAEANGVPYMLADSGENARGMLSASARTPGPGRTRAISALDNRQDYLADRVISHIERDLGPIANPHQLADDLLTQAQTRAAPLYESAYARPGADAFAARVRALLQRPSMQNALNRALRIAREEGREPTELGFAYDADGNVVLSGLNAAVPEAPELARNLTWQTFDYVKRGLDDVVEAYRDPTSGRLNLDTEGRAVNNTLRSFLRAFDEANPDYAAARSAYGGPVRGIDAMNRGRQALSMTADDLEAAMRDMTPFERDMFRTGARRAMAELAESRGDTANLVNAIAGTGKKRAMLARLFGDRAQFQRFVQTLEQEENAFQTFKRARTGSPTAPNVADDAALAAATGVVDIATTGAPIVSALRIAARAKGRREAERAQDAVASILGEVDPDRVRDLIARFRKAENQLRVSGRRARGRRVTAAGAASRITTQTVPEDED